MGQLLYRGQKYYFTKQLNIFFKKWKQVELSKILENYWSTNEDSDYRKSTDLIKFLEAFVKDSDLHPIKDMLAWKALQYNIMFRLSIIRLKHKRIIKVHYVEPTRRGQIVWKWLSVLIKLNLLHNKPVKCFDLVLKKFFLQSPEQHQFNNMKLKVYRMYLIQ